MSASRDYILSKFHEIGTLIADELEEKDHQIGKLETELTVMKTKLKNLGAIFSSATSLLDKEN